MAQQMAQLYYNGCWLGINFLNIPAGTGMDFLLKNNTNGTGIELLKHFDQSSPDIRVWARLIFGWYVGANILTVGTDIALLLPVTSIPY
jgi:hypothetical protein